jgi:hypothetical protein
MKTISKFISSLSDETIEAANAIHKEYTNEDNGEYFDAHMELHDLLIGSIEEFVLNERINKVDETYNGDHIEVFIVAAPCDGFVPSVRTDHHDAPASTIDPELAVPFEQAMVWGFGDAIIAHILEQGII